ncbi:MAG: 50S ribosomal protein L21 [Bacteroidetes bacterium]|nr:50S ribosomal protein L21 [Bacteroidota bacterium]HVZ38202.1 50S ribosomal protein L21 [Candidatus Kapabacteria bacterium]
MQAIVTIAGSQFRVKQDDTIVVPRLVGDVDSVVEFGNAIMVDGGNLSMGGSVSAKVVEHGRDATVLVFHKKRRKGYQKLNGHRQPYTKIQITGIKA